MTEQYKKRLIELAKEVNKSFDNVSFEYDSGYQLSRFISFKGKLLHLIGYIEALEEK